MNTPQPTATIDLTGQDKWTALLTNSRDKFVIDVHTKLGPVGVHGGIFRVCKTKQTNTQL